MIPILGVANKFLRDIDILKDTKNNYKKIL